ncbi:neogenin-like isoform X9 [Eriocheir sinensis]|uniref:neogenin-like isoform X9 n=1 Tax=Eriocheir sinensis TaxID=95602 RepID=UPI0021C7B52D|nr:neogenin-like isoform X9 [Eriocheir sinensis]
MCPGHHAGALHQGVQEQSPAGARLTNDTPSIWCLRNRECSHAGEYCCQANKSKVSQQATLTVKEAYALRDPQRPVLTAQPKSTIGKVGDKITVDCAANGYPEPAMVCLRDSATIHMALCVCVLQLLLYIRDLDTLFCGTTSSSLHIHGLQEEDEGTYRCRAENRDLDTLFCGTTTSSLHIHGLQEEDEGTYMCWAENREDSLDAVAHIQVQVAPRFLRQPANALAYEKENVELECSVYGQPEPSLHWLKNGELLVETDFCDGVDIYHLQRSKTLAAGTPRPPWLLQATSTSNRFITLAWHEPELNTDHTVGYSVVYKQEGSLRERVQNASAAPPARD